jgi:hypothetical protein
MKFVKMMVVQRMFVKMTFVQRMFVKMMFVINMFAKRHFFGVCYNDICSKDVG